jgi:hypothetical protein
MSLADKPHKKPPGAGTLLMSVLGVGVIAGGIAGFASKLGVVFPGVVVGLAALAGIGLGMWISWRWWVSVDEAVREAHKTGWFWGGSIGMGVALALAAGLQFADHAVPLAQFAILPGDSGLLLTGMAIVVILQLVGYVLVWAGWWLVRGR